MGFNSGFKGLNNPLYQCSQSVLRRIHEYISVVITSQFTYFKLNEIMFCIAERLKLAIRLFRMTVRIPN